jgi:nitrate reductase NapAB chaperone NapD
MPVSGLVLTLPATAATGAVAVTAGATLTDTLARLRSLPFLELGQADERRVAAVLDAPDYPTHDAHLDALRALPEIHWVDVVFHDFSDVSEFERPPRRDGGSHGPA